MNIKAAADVGRLHRRKGYALDAKFFIRAKYVPEEIAAYKAAYHATGKRLDDKAGDIGRGAYGHY